VFKCLAMHVPLLVCCCCCSYMRMQSGEGAAVPLLSAKCGLAATAGPQDRPPQDNKVKADSSTSSWWHHKHSGPVLTVLAVRTPSHVTCHVQCWLYRLVILSLERVATFQQATNFKQCAADSILTAQQRRLAQLTRTKLSARGR
jgi:hypothetical protein